MAIANSSMPMEIWSCLLDFRWMTEVCVCLHLNTGGQKVVDQYLLTLSSDMVDTSDNFSYIESEKIQKCRCCHADSVGRCWKCVTRPKISNHQISKWWTDLGLTASPHLFLLHHRVQQTLPLQKMHWHVLEQISRLFICSNDVKTLRKKKKTEQVFMCFFEQACIHIASLPLHCSSPGQQQCLKEKTNYFLFSFC